MMELTVDELSISKCWSQFKIMLNVDKNLAISTTLSAFTRSLYSVSSALWLIRSVHIMADGTGTHFPCLIWFLNSISIQPICEQSTWCMIPLRSYNGPQIILFPKPITEIATRRRFPSWLHRAYNTTSLTNSQSVSSAFRKNLRYSRSTPAWPAYSVKFSSGLVSLVINSEDVDWETH